jgi:hypothetical protein
MYRRRKAMLIRFYIGQRCASFHPECAQCQAWQLPPQQRWEHVKAGVAEWIEATQELGAACRAEHDYEGSERWSPEAGDEVYRNGQWRAAA